jgi:DNA-binding transcriptional MocR family regulator
MARPAAKINSSDWFPSLSGDTRRIHRDITAALAADIASGLLKAGDEMPSQRELADRLGINFTTVTRAYQEARERGLLVARPGQGTFVRGSSTETSALEMRVVDLTSNWPPSVPSQTALADALKAVVAEKGQHAIEYRGGPLDPSYCDAGRQWLSPLFGYDVGDRLTVSAGTRGAFIAVMSDVVGPGGVMLTEALTWPTIKAVAQILGISLYGVECDDEGLLPGALDESCRLHKPKALYCTPTAQNPTGATMSVKRRKAIGEVARAHSVTIIEDDAYGKLLSEPPPPIASLVPDTVVYVGGLAKTLAPGLRVAYVVCPNGEKARQISERMRLAMLVPPPVEAAVATRVILSGAGDTILREIKNEMKARHAVLKSCLGGTDLSVCPGALHAFLKLPHNWPRAEFISQLASRGVRAASSDAFSVFSTKVPHAIRLAIGAPSTSAELKQALQTIADLRAGEPSFTSRVV